MRRHCLRIGRRDEYAEVVGLRPVLHLRGQGVPGRRRFPVEAGRRVGTAVQPACDQQGADGEKRGPDKAAYEVKGVSADVAIAVGDDPDDVEIFVSYDGTELPPEVQRLEEASR
nr:DUF6281 family protein [Streptomyces sp. Ncost-T6T-1]